MNSVHEDQELANYSNSFTRVRKVTRGGRGVKIKWPTTNDENDIIRVRKGNWH